MTKVTIKNYQSIKNASFEIDGFTVIVGKNNIGKSAIIRAIEAPLANQVGKSFIRKGEKKTTIFIEKDEMDIKWEKGASATYTINDKREGAPEALQVFSKLNRDVPAPLIDAGFGKIEIGKEKVFPFIASQFDELFLVDKPGSVVTEVLAELYNIDTLSRADDMCQKVIKTQKSSLKTREADLKYLQEKLEVFADFEDIKKAVAEIVEKEKESEYLGTEIKDLTELYYELGTLTESLTVLRGITKVEIPDLSTCEKTLSDLQWLQKKEEKFKELTNNVKKLKGISKLKIPETTEIYDLVKEVNQLSEWDDTATKLIIEIKQQKGFLDSFDMSEVTKASSAVEQTLQEYSEIKTLEESFSKRAVTTKACRDELKDVKEKLEQKEKELAEIKVCPLCERPL